MKALSKKLTCFILALCMLVPVSLAACGEAPKAHTCESKCPKCGFCLNEDCTEPACELKCPGHKAEKPTVTGVSVTVAPKVNYYPGETFDITGLVATATLSNGKTRTYFDSDFSTWTHKDEGLTTDVTKITVTLPDENYTFDIAITVALPSDLSLTVDTSSLKDSYSTDDTIDFTTLTVRLVSNGYTQILKATDWKLKKGDVEFKDKSAVSGSDIGAGSVVLTVEYTVAIKANITVTVVEASKVISPAFIEAEDCAYQLSDAGAETSNKYTTSENSAVAQIIENGEVKDGGRVKTGASGSGAVSSLQQKATKVYFKFNVIVPQDGAYIIRARVQGTGQNTCASETSNHPLAVNVNGATGEDNKLKFTYNSTAQTVRAGNRLTEYCDEISSYKFTGWYNLFCWNMIDVNTVNLTKGENTIRIYMPKAFAGNIDYFEIVESAEAVTTKIMSMRTGSRVDLSKNTLYLTKGENLTKLSMTPAAHPCQYTLMYIRLTNGQEIPVTGTMLEGLVDYDKVNQLQTITVTYGGESASFNLMIEELLED